MKSTTFAVLFLCLGVSAATPRSAKRSAYTKKAIQDVLHIDQQRADALVKGDTDTLERIIAEDCTYVHPNGKFETKEEVLAGIKAKDRIYESIEREDVKVKLLGNVAVVTGRNNLKAKYQGKDYTVRNRFLRVYVRRRGRWQLAAHQATTIPEK
jgi:ketosteroid isomerase-like protein